jgi:hypothetical protein
MARGVVANTDVVRESGRTYWLARSDRDAGHVVSAFNKANGAVKGEHRGYRVETAQPVISPRDIRKDRFYFLSGKAGEEIVVGWTDRKHSVEGETVGPAKPCSGKRKSACKRSRHCDWEVGVGCEIAEGAEGAVKGGVGRAEFLAAVHSGNSPLSSPAAAKKSRKCSPAKKASPAKKKKAASPAKKCSPAKKSPAKKSPAKKRCSPAKQTKKKASPVKKCAQPAAAVAVVAVSPARVGCQQRMTFRRPESTANVSAVATARSTSPARKTNAAAPRCDPDVTPVAVRRTSARLRAAAAARK